MNTFMWIGTVITVAGWASIMLSLVIYYTAIVPAVGGSYLDRMPWTIKKVKAQYLEAFEGDEKKLFWLKLEMKLGKCGLVVALFGIALVIFFAWVSGGGTAGL